MLGYVPHFALSAPACWFYFRLLPTLVRFLPRPVWRLPAALFACGYALFDADGRRLSDALLRALDRPATHRARWSLLWGCWYQRHGELLLTVQSAHLTRAWARAHVLCDGTLPAGGTLLIAPHHTGQGFGLLALADHVEKLGTVAGWPPVGADLSGWEPSRRELVRYGQPILDRAFDSWLFHPNQAARQGLAFLQEGGYLSITGDDFYYPNTERAPLLGRAMTLPRGAAWLAQQSGKPIVPYMTVPWRGGWRLWIGEAVPPTQAGGIAVIEEGIRRAPESWTRTMAMAWRDLPAWSHTHTEKGA